MTLLTSSKCRTCTICLMCIIFPEAEACQTQHCNECIEGCFQSIGCFKDQMEFATMLTVEALFYSPEHWSRKVKNGKVIIWRQITWQRFIKIYQKRKFGYEIILNTLHHFNWHLLFKLINFKVLKLSCQRWEKWATF